MNDIEHGQLLNLEFWNSRKHTAQRLSGHRATVGTAVNKITYAIYNFSQDPLFLAKLQSLRENISFRRIQNFPVTPAKWYFTFFSDSLFR